MSRHIRRAIAAGGAVLAAAALTLAGTTNADAAGARPATYGTAHACAQTQRVGYANCFALVRTVNGKAMVNASPTGYGPADIRSAYNLGSASSGGATVAIVDAFDDPNAEADLAVYRSNNGLAACTTANGCFKKVNQTGGTSYPAGDSGWGLEISLDLDAVSAACPDCHILLVEATSNSFANLATAVNYASTVAGVKAISNSYGGGDTNNNAAYSHAGIAVVASTGDNGYQVQSPASYTNVVAVGGTSLKHATNARGWKETAWNGAGSGCSTLNAKPAWQSSKTLCSKKANADVSAVADPNTGLGVYDTFGFGGWLVVGGTSLASPVVGAVYAQGPSFTGFAGAFTWGNKTGNIYDVKSGSNGSCSPAVWCHAQKGWDGPTGLGTPNGVGAF